jgi:peptidoglycan/LPS O-acetylase OafA/YrhL
VAIFQIIYYQSNDIYFVYQNNNYYYFFLQLFFASNWEYKTVYSFNGPIWSISVEVLVYLVFFITLYQFKAPLKICLLILVITLILLVSKLFLIPKNILDCIWYFFSGGLTVCLLSVSKNRKFVDILSIALIIIIPAAILITQKNPNQNFSYVISAIFNGCFIYILSREISLKNKFTKIVDYFSNMTYSSYLLHFPIQLILVILFQVNKIELPLYSSLFFGFYILVTLLLSALTFRFLEKPLQDYIRFKFLYK